MKIQKNSISLIVLTVLSFLSITQKPTVADSVYAIPDHWGQQQATLNVYDVLEGAKEGHLEYRATYDLKFGGAADVVIDIFSNILFVTFENQKDIQLVNAKTFLSEGTVTAQGSSDLAGLELDYIDPNTIYLYSVDRGDNKLFVYLWDADAEDPNRLKIIPPDPPTGNNYYELLPEDPGTDPAVKACGLALDNNTGRLYVSQYYPSYNSIIQVYDVTDNFEHVETIDLNDYFEGNNNYAVDIDFDEENGWLYAGGYTGHRNLIRYDPNDSSNNHIEEIVKTGSSGVIGLAVSPGTDFVYMTTYNFLLETWDTDVFGLAWLRIDEEEIDGGAGVCVADVDFKPPFWITKDDNTGDEDCISPRKGRIKYSICYDYQWYDENDLLPSDFDSLTITDYLPEETDFISASDNGAYDPNYHTITWIVDLEVFDPNLAEPYDPNCFYLTVQTNKNVTPGSEVENKAKLIATMTIDDKEREYHDSYIINTDICECGEYGQVIYVDGNNDAQDPNGSSWATAFDDLQEALSNAWPCDEIWVAKADNPYIPTSPNDPNATFQLVNFVSLFGGFLGNEEDRFKRNWFTNETILSGDIAGNEDVLHLLNIDVEYALLDGFTMKNSSLAGVYCEDSSVVIRHNKITDNAKGIYCLNSEKMDIKNNWIYRNDYGIYMVSSDSTTIIQNNTIPYNSIAGIYRDSGTDPDISNCIVWGHPAGKDIVDCNAIYSCITDEDPGLGNINVDPNFPPFINEDNDDYHLDPNSSCVDAGNPNGSYKNQRDIDDHFRVLDGDGDGNKRIDIGADEHYDKTDNIADFNKDDIVNYIDFGKFSTAWLNGPSDPNWQNGKYDLDADNQLVDTGDLVILAEQWLWVSPVMMPHLPPETTSLKSMTMASSETPQPELSIEDQIEQAEGNIEFLEDIWENEPEVRENHTEEEWEDFIGSIEAWIEELEDSLE